MSEAIIVALIGGICTAIPSLIATVVINNKSIAVMQYKIEDLTKKVENHNNVVERMAVAENSIKSAHRRIDDLVDK
ncbi:hypothetical protein [[Eubacterium] hominis]|uniref:hypothetical protein n=1 Tax=[Eubacterium] hominis TaxID=2764325 RepID=UPI003A4D6EBC